MAVLSGGERRRVALCRLLLKAPDILLLDEPTNHLDAESVAWLEKHLQQYAGTIIAVTHDRYFLDNVAGWILELDRGYGIPWKGNYSSWLEQKQQRLAREARAESARQKTLQRELEWLHMSPRARQAKAKARINLGIRRRLAPLLGNDRKRIELVHLLLLSFPGTPVLYYGDELGMGDNVFLGDRNGVRTPMQWSSDKNAGFSRASPQALFLPIILDPEYHYEAVNVEAQQANANSLWWWLKRLLTLRQRRRALGRGSIQFLRPENRKILVFTRRHENEVILVVANLSRFPQPAQIDLSEFKGLVPVELFGRSEFPTITDAPYALTLSPHAAFWFSLEPLRGAAAVPETEAAVDVISLTKHWREIFHDQNSIRLERALTSFLLRQRWFNTIRRLKSLQIKHTVPIPAGPITVDLLSLNVDFIEGDPEEYLLPLAFATGDQADQLAPRGRLLRIVLV